MSMPWTGGGECRDEDAVADVVPAHDGALGHAAVGGSPYYFTVDLGSDETFQEVDSDWLQTDSAAIYLPSQLQVSVSTDGTSFTTVGTMNAPAVDSSNQSHDYRLLNINVTARYVRITVTPASSAWSFTDQIEVKTPLPRSSTRNGVRWSWVRRWRRSAFLGEHQLTWSLTVNCPAASLLCTRPL
jgi:hypothetical protein